MMRLLRLLRRPMPPGELRPAAAAAGVAEPELTAALSTATRRQVIGLAAVAGTACYVRRGRGMNARSGFLDEAALPDAALAYAALGWPVFPLRPGDKIPLIPKTEGGNGVHDATTDPDQLREWWDRQPDANIGLAAGVTSWCSTSTSSDFLAEEPDGADTLLALERRFGPLPETVRQQTGGLGWQRFFTPDPRIRTASGCCPASIPGRPAATSRRRPASTRAGGGTAG
jgi:hypothetical protein